MPELKIPYARDDKLNVISPEEARRNTAYNCECGSPVFLKAGKKKVSHFSHYSDKLNCKHAKDTIHSLAQFSLYESVKKATTDAKHIISIQLPCSYCENHHAQPLDLFEKEYQVDMEYRIKTKQGFIIADIALIHPTKKPFVFEIFNTSRVDENKGRKFSSSGIAWVEISAEDMFSKRYKRLEKFDNETNLTPLQQPYWIPPMSEEQCPKYLTPEQIEDKKKLEAINRTISSNKEKRSLRLNRIKQYAESRKEAVKKALEVGTINIVQTVLLDEFGYKHIADLLPRDESGKIIHPINLLEHKINDVIFFFSRHPFLFEGEIWWDFKENEPDRKERNIFLIAREMNNLQSLGFEVKVNESETNISEHTLDLIDDKRKEIYQKRSYADTSEVDKVKRKIPAYEMLARKLIMEDLKGRFETDHKLIRERFIKEYGKDINIPI